MTALEALAILESAVLECKKRDINTPEVKAALDLLERYIWPKWVIPQFRHHLENQREPLEKREGQQQVTSRYFPRHSQLCSRTSRCESGCSSP